MTPTILAQAAKDAAQGTGVRVTVFDTARIERLKMGALLGVARGSSEEPRFISMEYQGASKKESPIVLVGKGVTFDSGGINIKSMRDLYDMHMDMSGAAVVLHAIIAAAKLKIRKNIIVLIPAAENMVSGSSYRVGDILRSMSGSTIEVTNTDAEGRLLLADALTYAKRYKPKAVIDVATLTGAAMVALGQRANAVFSEHARLVRVAFEASEITGDRIWQLPLWDMYADDMRSQFADMVNWSKSGYGGAITSAIFLKHFAQDYPWMHIDMAPRMVSIEGDFLAKGATAEPMRLLVQMLQKL
jgi:leucyl aminopeptidase